ncbi:MAG TPA: inner membrane CreD family protein [Pyrinomonadaceae bacterium]|nr:inner membrane CreD family protein [Pyrinomonadaceae bacterium]
MIKRIIAIAFIFVCASVAWAILGGTIFSRTYSLDAVAENRVASTWGTPQNQAPPSASFTQMVPVKAETIENGKKVIKINQQEVTTPLPLESSAVDVALDLDHRQKGLLWYSTYKVIFTGVYGFHNSSDKEENVTFRLNFPTAKAIYDDLTFSVDGNSVSTTNKDNAALAAVKVGPGKVVQLRVGYRSQGLNEWRYNFGSQDVAQVHNFTLRMKTNFKDIDFPDNSISPSEKHETSDGWALTWSYKNLLSGYQIAMIMPEKLQPGPLAGRISFFAPVSLFFFFFLMLIITTLRGIELHPMNYFFLAAAFFSFHLLLAYLVDHVSIHLAFAISSAVSVFLVVSYLRLVVGMRFASREAALAQFIYLVAFSYAFFLKGFTGLAVTIGSIVTLFVVMQVTGRIRWADKFAPKPVAEPAGEFL